jgi:hypothetical protein
MTPKRNIYHGRHGDTEKKLKSNSQNSKSKTQHGDAEKLGGRGELKTPECKG